MLGTIADRLHAQARATFRPGATALAKGGSLMLAAALTWTLVAAPAVARNAGTASATIETESLKVYPRGCGDASYELTVDGAQWADWRAQVRIYKPSGRIEDTETFKKGQSTVHKESLCTGLDPFGRYKVSAEVTGYNADHVVVGTTTAKGYFRFSVKPKDKTKLIVHATHVRYRFWKFTGTLTRRGDRFGGQWITVQARSGTTWFDVELGKTKASGVVHFTARPEAGAGRFPLRLLYDGSTETRRATSKNFRIYP